MSDQPFIYSTIDDYVEAYQSGRCTPTDVARRFLTALRRSEELTPPMRIFIAQRETDLLAQAASATARYAEGKTLGPLDGVPIAVKDEIDQAGYPTTVGTSFFGRDGDVAGDAAAVSKLRAAGALLLGKVNMQEIGIGVTGINVHHGAVRNPYGPAHMTGGSSSGSGAAVAAGLCPVAIGADGGGSIRIPAALCGLAGIKGTYGRVSERGAAPLCWSVAHIGPLAATLRDAARVLELISGPDEHDPATLGQPPLGFETLDYGRPKEAVSGLRIGWCKRWAARAEPDVLAACEAAVQRLVDAGATRVEVELEHLDLHAAVQYLTIGLEMATSQYEQRREGKREYAADTRLLLEMASQVPAVEYLRAQRLRTLIHDELVRVLQDVDVLASPATASTAPKIPADALKAGLSDDRVLEALTAFSFPANLSGQPALSVPVGYDAQGLPIGLQLMGRHWDERTMVAVGLAVEADGACCRPPVFYQLLD